VPVEFRYGTFARPIPLLAGAKEDDVKASYKDGIPPGPGAPGRRGHVFFAGDRAYS
jgi:hypothetical protein